METIRVLVIEDEELIRNLYADLLQDQGYQVLIAKDAMEGIEQLRRFPVDVILLDIVMPEMTGLEALRIVREIAPETPVIIVTSYPTSGHAIEALKLGAYDFISKSFKSDELVLAVQRAAEKRRLLLENQRLLQGFQEKVQELATLIEVGRTLNSTLNLEELLHLVMEKAQQLLKSEASSLMLVDRTTNELSFTVALGERGRALKEIRLKMGQGIAGWVAERGEPLLINEVHKDPRFFPKVDELTRFATKSILCVPVQVDGRTIGVIEVINRKGGGKFQEKDLDLLSAIAAQAGIAIENARLYIETERRNRALSSLLEISRDLSSTLELEALLFKIALKPLEVIPAARSGIILLDDALRYGYVTAGFADGRSPQSEGGQRIELAFYPEIRKVIESKQPLIILDAVHDPLMQGVRILIEPLGLKSLLVVPLISKERVVGVLSISQFGEIKPFTPEEVNLCQTLANQAVVAIENARLYEELKRKNEELEEADRHKSEFLANMSHELRTPLNSIIGFSEVLQDRLFGPLNEKQAHYIDNIHKSGHHLLALINDLLDLSKVEAGKMELRPEAFPLSQALEEALTLIRPQAEKKGIILALEVSPSLGTIIADPAKFKQILYNLLSNAVKFTPSGGTVTVSASVRREALGVRGEETPPHAFPLTPHVVEITVTDTGIGIKPEDLSRLFQPFTQLEPAFTKQYQGTGLGLALTKRLVELHGGEIWAKSEGEGKGSTFTVRLPLSP